jgi:uncharacterized protein (DUF1697 family)
MPELRTLFSEVGAADVETYVQSGNVVFTSADEPPKLIAAIETRIRQDLGLNVTVLIRTGAELAKVVKANPFADPAHQPAALHVTFLAEKPVRSRAATLDPSRSEPDEFRLVGHEVYLYCPNGYGRSKLTNAYFEKQLGVAATTRNWKTVTKLAELAST